MKKIIYTLTVLMLSASIFLPFGQAGAQVPQSFKYQAVVRDGSGDIITDQQVGLQVSILQGSTSGTAVYVETHPPTTNGFGLINLKIGKGTVVSGDFSMIDWGNDSYFIKIEIDATGGTSYTEMGTSQLLSVPYALHAETVKNITETDPVFEASVSGGITATDTGYWNNKLDAEADGSVTNEIQTISRTGLTVTLSNGGGTFQDSVNVYTNGIGIDITNNIISSKTYSVGDFSQGGIVFWVDETGQHGLVCAKQDQSNDMRWYAGTNGYTRANGDGPLAGEMNTAIIIASQVAIGDDGGTYAARICAELQITEGGKTYGDWYLPSKEELNLMYQNKSTINATAIANGGSGFSSDYYYYWSSTENSNFDAWSQRFDNGEQDYEFKDDSESVRAVRAF